MIEVLSNFAFKFKLHRYTKVAMEATELRRLEGQKALQLSVANKRQKMAGVGGAGFMALPAGAVHSSTTHLHLSHFQGGMSVNSPNILVPTKRAHLKPRN
jgi:hypothetical protein